jgi:hypothetical protein
MMRTSRDGAETRATARLTLVQRQRRFEWELARAEQTRVANKLVAGKTHDLLNLVQIVQLATLELAQRCGEGGKEFLDDLTRAAVAAESSLHARMEIARPEQVVVRGPTVGAAVTRVLDEIRPAVTIDAHLAVHPDTATALVGNELAHLVIGLALDAADAERIELYVRDRTIDGTAWVEIVRWADASTASDDFDLRAVEQLARRVGGELARSDRRGGGTELVVALPAI